MAKAHRLVNVKAGNVFKHFKHDLVDTDDKLMYMYEIIAVAVDSETLEKKVVYRALYETGGEYTTWVRDYNDFISEVDKQKYPDAKQKYKFEQVRDWKKK